MASRQHLQSRSNDDGLDIPTFKFVNAKNEPLHFIICTKNDEKRRELTKIIVDKGGKVDGTLNLFGPHSIVLVDDDETEWEHTGDVFKFSYITDCQESNALLDVSQFLKQESRDFVRGFEYMKIFYAQAYGWNTVPAEYCLRENHFSFPSTSGNAQPEVDQQDSTHNSGGDNVNLSTSDAQSLQQGTEQPKRLYRRGGTSYTQQEDVAILRYIVTLRLFDNLKGIVIWKNMELDQICPTRTWQSMREHTTKILSRHLDDFDFLTEEQKELIRWNSVEKP